MPNIQIHVQPVRFEYTVAGGAYLTLPKLKYSDQFRLERISMRSITTAARIVYIGIYRNDQTDYFDMFTLTTADYPYTIRPAIWLTSDWCLRFYFQTVTAGDNFDITIFGYFLKDNE